jgi:hypothetical protein
MQDFQVYLGAPNRGSLLNFDLAPFAFKTAQKSPTIEGFGDCTALAQNVHESIRVETLKRPVFSTHHPLLGALDGQDRRRRNENGEGQRS